MNISTWYTHHFEARLKGRYVHSKHINPILDLYQDVISISVIGTSENGNKISCVKVGNGKKVILGWSQMHGNESTTTKALFDFFKFIAQKKYFSKEIDLFLKTYTFYVIPILNPDGAELYTRENINTVDLNRDAKNLSQPESRVLRGLFNKINPELCLNLHDQRTMYSLPNGKSATVSFLAPSANAEREVTSARRVAMGEIERLNTALSIHIPGQIGRYDDAFNENCVGDTFQMVGVPTILFEAGHYPGDYQREKTRAYIFYALLSLFRITEEVKTANNTPYSKIPENDELFKDVIIRNVDINGEITSLSMSYEGNLVEGSIHFVPILDQIGSLEAFFGHKEIDAHGVKILLNSHENVFVGEKVETIVDRISGNCLFS
ncbi:MAG: peptidase M14 [Flavobacteriaceae bacterium]|nr:peptidase M14 [Flavobacteriaceae bacterium]